MFFFFLIHFVTQLLRNSELQLPTSEVHQMQRYFIVVQQMVLTGTKV